MNPYWEINKAKLYQGDCLDVMLDFSSKSVDLVLTDLPYGKTNLKWDKQIDLDTLWLHWNRICRGPVILMAMQPFTTMLIQSNLKDFRYTLVWDKGKGSNPLLANKQPMRSHEDICVFYKRQPIYNPQMTEGNPYIPPRTGGSRTNSIVGSSGDRAGWKQETKDTSKRFPRSIIKASIHCGSKKHPTKKPIPLMEWLIKTYTHQGMTVLDCCMGAGSTGLACLNTGRGFIGVEKESKYFEIARKRIEDLNRGSIEGSS